MSWAGIRADGVRQLALGEADGRLSVAAAVVGRQRMQSVGQSGYTMDNGTAL